MAPPRFAFLDHPGPIAFAHRGGAAENPENTWASFSHARDLGYRYMETDVHATADGVVAVIHDPSLDRVTDRAGAVAELTLGRGVHGPHRRRASRSPASTSCWHLARARWNIDAKHEAVVGPLVDVLKRAGAVERVCVTSFSDARIGRVRAAAGPTLCTSTGPRGIAALRLASAVSLFNRWPLDDQWRGAGAAQVPLAWGKVPILEPAFHRLGPSGRPGVHAWTIDDEPVMERLLDLGVDGIMTDRPTLLKEVLERRGQWSGA